MGGVFRIVLNRSINENDIMWFGVVFWVIYGLIC